MRGRFNDALRQVIAFGIRRLGALLQVAFRIKLLTFKHQQRKLRQQLKIDTNTPILLFGTETENHIELAAQQVGDKALWAQTSGTTNHPKRLLYTKRRLNILKWIYIDSFARMCAALSIKRTSLYVFSSFDSDDSLTNLLLDDCKLPDYFTTLQAPYRVQSDPSIKELVSGYGSGALRLWLILLANPGVLYATNPSTMVAFFDEVRNNWARVQQLTKDWYERPQSFSKPLRLIARRIESTGSKSRIAAVASSDSALEISQWAPAFATYMCWTGGYVQPFLDQLAANLPSHSYRLVPMYSMSTETIETVPCFEQSVPSFLPIAPGVLYEFLKEGSFDHPENLLRPDELVEGCAYSMVVSDSFGLRRYQTDDLFQCHGMLHGLPKLSFSRRRGLEYSFTGEKLTGAQLTAAYDRLNVEAFLTCVPCSCCIPHYKVLAIGDTRVRDVSSDIDDHLAALNLEYKSKRRSGRLGPITFENISLLEFLRHVPISWETQFKFLPLYREPIGCHCGHNSLHALALGE